MSGGPGPHANTTPDEPSTHPVVGDVVQVVVTKHTPLSNGLDGVQGFIEKIENRHGSIEAYMTVPHPDPNRRGRYKIAVSALRRV